MEHFVSSKHIPAVLLLVLPTFDRSAIFFLNDTPTTEIYTLSLHDALPISSSAPLRQTTVRKSPIERRTRAHSGSALGSNRSEEHTSELQSQFHIVCRLLLEKKKKRPLRTRPLRARQLQAPPRPRRPTPSSA